MGKVGWFSAMLGKMKRVDRSATVIHSGIRMKLVWQRMALAARKVTCATLIQSLARMAFAHRRAARMATARALYHSHAAATVIQCSIRRKLAWKRYRKTQRWWQREKKRRRK